MSPIEEMIVNVRKYRLGLSANKEFKEKHGDAIDSMTYTIETKYGGLGKAYAQPKRIRYYLDSVKREAKDALDRKLIELHAWAKEHDTVAVTDIYVAYKFLGFMRITSLNNLLEDL